MLNRILCVLCIFMFASCSLSRAPEDIPDNLTSEASDLDDEIFKTEGDAQDLEDELYDDELDIVSGDDEFEDPELSIAANDNSEGISEDELDLDGELDDELDGDIVADSELDDLDESGLSDDELDLDDELDGDLSDDELDIAEDNFSEDELDLDDEFEGELDGDVIADSELDDLDESDLDDDELDLEDTSVSANDELDLDDEFDVEIDDDSIADSDFENVTIDDDDLIVEDDLNADFNSDGLSLPSSNKVVSVDYDNSAGGAFVVKTKDPTEYSTEFIPETNQFVVELKNTKIDKTLQRPFLTKDFKQNFGALNSYQDADGDAKLVVQLKNELSPYVKVSGNQISITAGTREQALLSQNTSGQVGGSVDADGNPTFAAATGGATGAKALKATTLEDYLLENTNFYGKPISIQVKDADIVDVIHLISEEVGANLVVSEGVKGKVSIKLKEVPWDQALLTLMKTRALGYVRSGSVLRIAPLSELQAESEAAKLVQNARKSLTPYHVKVFPLSYASPETLEAKLRPFLTSTSEAGVRPGQLISEARSSSIIVNDTREVINNIEKLIKELDRPPLQVMIEAKVVEASKEFEKVIGSTFLNSASTASNVTNVNANNNFNWNEGGSTNLLQNTLQVTGLNFLGSLTHILRLNEMERKIKVLSAPKILAMNNEAAFISQVSQVLNRQVTSDEGGNLTVTEEAVPVELRLEVTPQITSDSNVIMDMTVKREFPGTVSTNGSTPVNTREAKTKIIVGNNKTAVIGGIYQVDTNKGETGIPVLRRIPLLKWIFANKEYRKTDSELMVFVTPRILNRKGILSPVGKTPTAAVGRKAKLL